MTDATCSEDGCEKRARGKSGFCKYHYTQDWRRRQGSCCVEGCDNPVSARKRCAAHYLRLMAGEPDRPVVKRMKRDGACLRDGCDLPVYARGYCAMHSHRVRKNGDPGPVGPLKAPDGAGFTDPKSGYRYVTIDGRKVLEHRYVMERMKDRYLWPWENVHHKNGRRADNRPENLELWVKPQPAGQRVEDLVAFVIEHYPAELENRGWIRRQEVDPVAGS